MSSINIVGTAKTPTINFDPHQATLKIKGRSIPEHAIEFYRPLVESLRDYKANPAPSTKVDISLEYFNTASSKCILDVLKLLAEIQHGGKVVIINWNYEEDDYSIKESGDDLQSITGLNFKMNLLRVS